jgi:hypothetical protein
LKHYCTRSLIRNKLAREKSQLQKVQPGAKEDGELLIGQHQKSTPHRLRLPIFWTQHQQTSGELLGNMAGPKKRKDRSGGDGQDARGMKRSKVRPSLVQISTPILRGGGFAEKIMLAMPQQVLLVRLDEVWSGFKSHGCILLSL